MVKQANVSCVFWLILNRDELYQLFQLTAQTNSLVFCVYSPKVTNRLNYTLQFVFEHVLNVRYKVFQNKTDWENESVLKINYSHDIIKNSFHITPSGLLQENGINKTFYPPFEKINGQPVLFPSSSGDVPFDIFSAVFYCISRYEEWQDFIPDTHQRFERNQSVFFKAGYHHRPLVNLWIEDWKTLLNKKYSHIQWPQKKFRLISTIDVDNLYAYKHKGFLRTTAAIAKDAIHFDFSNLARRVSVLRGQQPDPFDVYDELIQFSKNEHFTLLYFFLQHTGTKYDRTVNPHSPYFKTLFHKLVNSGIYFGLHPSYHTLHNYPQLQRELALIKNQSGINIQVSRQHYLRFNIQTYPQYLIQAGIVADFSLGFASGSGYRAGTFTPFLYYNFKEEKQEDLCMVPFVVMDGVYFNYDTVSAQSALKEMIELKEQAANLNGIFISVFHERTFDEVLYPGFRNAYKKIYR